jgi:glycosyltransferase involved in cell wall biosynthesis
MTEKCGYHYPVRKVDLTLVVPCFNECESIPLFVKEVLPTLRQIGASCEIIFVDDGSTDDTWKVIKQQKNLSKIKILGIKFDRNYGQMAALEAGIRKSNSEFVLTIDVDLQHPIRFIPIMWNLRNDHAVIAMRQIKRQDRRTKASLSKVFYFLLKRVVGYQVNANVSDFRLLSRETVDYIIPRFKQSNVIRFLLPQLGIKQHILDYQVEPRVVGTSKYSFKKMSLLAQKSIVTTSTRLLSISIYLAALSIFFAAIVFTYVLAAYFTNNAIIGWASMLGTVLVLFSGTFVILAIIGIYIGRIIELLNATPEYSIKEEL